MIELSWGCATDIGNRRSRNEDAYLALDALFVVADGMGGHERGDRASELAIIAMRALADAGVFSRNELFAAARRADASIADERTDGLGMGTTITGLAVTGGSSSPDPRLVVFNVGDSRTYLLRAGSLIQLTVDHSVVQGLIDEGTISAEEAAVHPDRNVITRSLGTGGPLDIDWWVLDPIEGDRFLVTSDGLTKEVGDQEIARCLGVIAAPQEAADALVAEALRAGGRDNVTVIVVDLDRVSDPAGGSVDPLDADTNPRFGSSDAVTVPPTGA